jgi:hypothetical protein
MCADHDEAPITKGTKGLMGAPIGVLWCKKKQKTKKLLFVRAFVRAFMGAPIYTDYIMVLVCFLL